MASTSLTSNQKLQNQSARIGRPSGKPSTAPTNTTNAANAVQPTGTKPKPTPVTNNTPTEKPSSATNPASPAKTKKGKSTNSTGTTKPPATADTIMATAPDSTANTKATTASVDAKMKPAAAATKAKRKSPVIVAPESPNSTNSESVSPRTPPPTFYSKAIDYWIRVPPTVDGMLGGYSSLNVPDVEDSHAFLDSYGPKTTAYALDCGCGIGRVTKNVLLPRFNLVDMVEQNPVFLDKAEEYIGAQDFAAVGERFCAGLQDFIPPSGRYDLVWIQWVLGHLTDITLVGFLKRCAQALSPGGRIVVKENVTSGELDAPAFDDVDSSFTRSRKAYLTAFQEAELEVTGERLQTNFPSSIYPVRMFALKPIATEDPPESNPSE